MISVEKTIISQYANSPTIIQLIHNMDQYIDPRQNFDDFYEFVWNVDTAQGFGLDIWGRIVNVGRYLTLTPPVEYFGFSQALEQTFGSGTFYPAAGASNTYRLADTAYRQLILVKAIANISSSNARSLNQLLQNMFAGRGRCYVNDLGNMAMRYTFEFALTDYEYAIITQSGAIPRPAGVLTSVFDSPLPVWGFAEAGIHSSAPFGQAPFAQ